MKKVTAITVRQPMADNLLNGSKLILVSKKTDFRGLILVCSNSEPHHRYMHHYSNDRLGKSICSVDVVDCVKVSNLSRRMWNKHSGLSMAEKSYFRHQYVLICESIKQVIPITITPQKGMFEVEFEEETFLNITESLREYKELELIIIPGIILVILSILWVLLSS